MVELYTEPIIQSQTWADILSKLRQIYPATDGETVVGGRFIGVTLEGAQYRSSVSGARFEILPDPNTGCIAYNAAGTKIFEILVAGTNTGDIVMGNYAGGAGLMWDQSLGTFSIKGALSASSLDIPDTTTANSFHVNTDGDAWWGATTIGSAVAKVLKTGVATFTDIVATGTVNATGGYIGTTTALVFESQGIDCGVTGHIRGGQTAYNTGTGFFLGYSGGQYSFSIGEATKYLTYDPTAGLRLRGSDFSILNGQESLGTITVRNAEDAVIQRFIFQQNSFYSMSIGAVLSNLGSAAKPWGVGFLDYSIPATLDGHMVHKKHLDDTLVNLSGGYTIFGNGQDGNKIVGSNETLTSDKYYNNLTVNDGFTLNPGGYRIFVKGTLTIVLGGRIARDGNVGANGTNGGVSTNEGIGGAGGAAVDAGYLDGGLAGVAGGNGGEAGGTTGQTSAGTGINAGPRALGSAGTTGGEGGDGGNGGYAGLSGGGGGTITSGSIVTRPYTIPQVVTFLDSYAGAYPAKYQGGASGGGGGPGGGGKGDYNPTTGAGGGGGGSGGSAGIICIYAKDVVFTGGGEISVMGGNGGNGGRGGNSTASSGNSGGGGGGGGGAGGNGGVIVFVYGTFIDSVPQTDPTTYLKVLKGEGGAYGDGGTGYPGGNDGQYGVVGQDGNNGNTIVIKN